MAKHHPDGLCADALTAGFKESTQALISGKTTGDKQAFPFPMFSQYLQYSIRFTTYACRRRWLAAEVGRHWPHR